MSYLSVPRLGRLGVASAWALVAALVAAPSAATADGPGSEDGAASDEGAAAGPAPATPVVYATATVEARPLSSATAAVTVVDRVTIEELGARTAADALRFVPGVDVTGNGARGGLTTAQIRGGDPNFTLVLLDGVPLNDSTYQVGDVFDLEGLPASAIERIEVVRGPFSSVYGPTGLAGVINVVTRGGAGAGGRAAGSRAAVGVEAGNASLRRATASVAGGVGGQGTGGDRRGSYWLGISWEEEAERIARESFAQRSALGRLELPLGDRADFRLAGRVAGWEGDDYPDASGGPVYGSGELRRSDHDEASLGVELFLGGSGEGAGGGESTEVGDGRRQKVSLALYRHRLDQASPAVPPEVPSSIVASTYTRTRLGWSAPLVVRGGLRLAGGVGIERESGDNRSVLVLPPFLGGEVAGDYAIERTSAGAYAELLVEGGDGGTRVLEVGSRARRARGRGAPVEPAGGGELCGPAAASPASTPRPAAPSSCRASSPSPARPPSAATPTCGRSRSGAPTPGSSVASRGPPSRRARPSSTTVSRT